MTFSVGLFRSALVLLASFALSGCLRSAPGQLDEEKESHFLLGRTRASAMDYQGAIESFERALEVNPRSAAAHFELACLFERREADAATSIYHYQQYMKLRPKADNVETVKQHILALKQELAKTVSLGVVTERQQREFERLVEENRRLNEEVQGWRAFSARMQVSTNQPGAGQAAPRLVKPSVVGNPATNTLAAQSSPPAAPALLRTHTVKSGETAATIARKYGLKLEALRAANPKMEPRRLRAGQTLNIPAASP